MLLYHQGHQGRPVSAVSAPTCYHIMIKHLPDSHLSLWSACVGVGCKISCKSLKISFSEELLGILVPGSCLNAQKWGFCSSEYSEVYNCVLVCVCYPLLVSDLTAAALQYSKWVGRQTQYGDRLRSAASINLAGEVTRTGRIRWRVCVCNVM